MISPILNPSPLTPFDPLSMCMPILPHRYAFSLLRSMFAIPWSTTYLEVALLDFDSGCLSVCLFAYLAIFVTVPLPLPSVTPSASPGCPSSFTCLFLSTLRDLFVLLTVAFCVYVLTAVTKTLCQVFLQPRQPRESPAMCHCDLDPLSRQLLFRGTHDDDDDCFDYYK